MTPPGSAKTSQSSQLQHNQFQDHSDLHQQSQPEPQVQKQSPVEAPTKQKEKQKEKRFFCF